MNKPSHPAAREASAMLRAMNPVLDPSVYVFCTTADEVSAAEAATQALALVRESEGVTLILECAQAGALGFDVGLPMRRIVLEVHSALDGVGLTAAVASALAAENIPCNVLAAYHHDHIFVPETMAERALSALRRVQARENDEPRGP